MFLCPCILVGKIRALITHFIIQATLHMSAYNDNNIMCQRWYKTKLSKDTRILRYSIDRFHKYSTTICKTLNNNSYPLVIIGYHYRKKRVRQIQNACMTESGIFRVYTRLQKRWHPAEKYDSSTMRFNGFMGNVRKAQIINALLSHYSWKSLFTTIHFLQESVDGFHHLLRATNCRYYIKCVPIKPLGLIVHPQLFVGRKFCSRVCRE